MKLKRLPEDFRVEEALAPTLDRSVGPFALYKLTKKSLGTLEAIQAIARHWRLPRQAIAVAGLKDKHALTTQHLTIHHGPRRGLKETNLELEYVGQLDRAIHARDIKKNQFAIVLRDLSQAEADRTAQAATSAARGGLPNYFDDQRFGSLGQSNEFIAHPWCRGDYGRAVWLAIADDNVHDGPIERAEKQFLREHWGDWHACFERWPKSRFAAVLAHLASQPGDFRRAIARVPHELRSLWLAAFQSHVWNQVLAAAITNTFDQTQLEWHTIGGRDLPLISPLAGARQSPLGALILPLPSARLHLNNTDLQPFYDQALAAEGLQLRQIRVKYPRDTFFSKGERPAVFWPDNFWEPLVESDDLYQQRFKLTLRFSLDRAMYATIFIKGIVHQPVTQADQEPDAFDELDDVE